MQTPQLCLQNPIFHTAGFSLHAVKASKEALISVYKRALLTIENSCNSYKQVLGSADVIDHGVHSYARMICSCQNGNKMSFLVTHFFLVTQLSMRKSYET